MQPGANRWLSEARGRAATYDDRWEELAARGDNVHGEADLVSWLLESVRARSRESVRARSRESVRARSREPGSVLDAGCGTGRVAIELHRRGLDVVGVDLDPSMLARARAKSPDVEWVHADLVDVDLGRRFEVVALAGNVMIYLEPGTEGAVVANLARHLEPGGALVAGFELQPGRYDLASYDEAARAAGLTLAERWATWDREPYDSSEHRYAVSVHRPGE